MNRNIEQNRRIQEAIIQSKFICEKTDFVITDQTEYNFNFAEIAAKTLYSEHSRLFCNIHRTLIFNKVIIRQEKEIENV